MQIHLPMEAVILRSNMGQTEKLVPYAKHMRLKADQAKS